MSRPFKLLTGALVLLLAAVFAFIGVSGNTNSPRAVLGIAAVLSLIGVAVFAFGLRSSYSEQQAAHVQMVFLPSRIPIGLGNQELEGALINALSTGDTARVLSLHATPPSNARVAVPMAFCATCRGFVLVDGPRQQRTVVQGAGARAFIEAIRSQRREDEGIDSPV